MINQYTVLAAIFLGYVFWTVFWPWRNCSRCDGASKFKDPILGTRHRACTKCDRSGRQVRLDARLLRWALRMGPPK